MMPDMDSSGLIGMDIPDFDTEFSMDDDGFSCRDTDEPAQYRKLLQSSETSIIESGHFLHFIALNRLQADFCPDDRHAQMEQNRLARDYYRDLKPAARRKLVTEFTDCIRSFIDEIDIGDDSCNEMTDE